MNQRILLLFTALSLAILMFGCLAGGSFLSANLTNVELSEDNFNIVARNVPGHAKSGYLIGVSYSQGPLANTLALFRVSGTATLYDDAVRDLWKNYEDRHGSTEGKKLLLTNIRYDTDILNLVIYTQTELYIHADIVEIIAED